MLEIIFEPNKYPLKMNVRKDKKEIGDRICDTFFLSFQETYASIYRYM